MMGTISSHVLTKLKHNNLKNKDDPSFTINLQFAVQIDIILRMIATLELCIFFDKYDECEDELEQEQRRECRSRRKKSWREIVLK